MIDIGGQGDSLTRRPKSPSLSPGKANLNLGNKDTITGGAQVLLLWHFHCLRGRDAFIISLIFFALFESNIKHFVYYFQLKQATLFMDLFTTSKLICKRTGPLQLELGPTGKI